MKDQVAHVLNNSLDGVNVDFEDAIPATNKSLKDALTSLIHELAVGLRQKIVNAQV